jgi:hypothetical protein
MGIGMVKKAPVNQVDTANPNSLGAKLLGGESFSAREILPGDNEDMRERKRQYVYAIAIHEASHAVADVRAGSAIDFVNIEFCKDDGSEGCTKLLPDTPLLSLDDLLMVLFAGFAGELTYVGPTNPSCLSHDSVDMDNACARENVSDEDKDRRLGQALSKALAFCESKSVEAAVREIAELLVEHTRVEGPLVHEIVTKYACVSI